MPIPYKLIAYNLTIPKLYPFDRSTEHSFDFTLNWAIFEVDHPSILYLIESCRAESDKLVEN